MNCSCFLDCIQEALKCWCGSPLWFYHKYTPQYKIKNFVEKIKVYYDTQYNRVDGLVRIKYHNKIDNMTIASIYYRPFIGQVLSFRMEEEYNVPELIEEILRVVIEDIRAKSTTKNIWIVATENHIFWSNVFNKGFSFKESVHVTCPKPGYFMEIGLVEEEEPQSFESETQ